MSVDRGDIPLLTASWPRKPASWSELERCIAALADAHGQDPVKAVADLKRNGPLVRLLCAQLGYEKPRRKRGPKTKNGVNDLTVNLTDGAKREGLKGKRLSETVHELLTGKGSFFGDVIVAPRSLERRYYRARKKRSPDIIPAKNSSGD
ncbi:hypothetical protein [Methylobacterium sp. Leaf456]|uniref:hypothetical protein n=1 Tax=Methylobacterium sp. Leaf456 TaxID=1736382 RepID=UPI0012E361DE|nr:hypothetical protein [Methylobacterium sp. Leaf456]